MFHSKLRRAAAATALVSALLLLCVPEVSAGTRGRGARESRNREAAAAKVETLSPWAWLVDLLQKRASQLDPLGVKFDSRKGDAEEEISAGH
jgi:hypothetical protein